MRLNTRIAQCNVGMLSSRPAWQLFYNLELTREESELVQTYKLGEHVLCRYTDNEGKEGFLEVRQAVNGKGGNVYFGLGAVSRLKQSLIEGCNTFRAYLRAIQEIRAGGGVESFDYPLHSEEVNRSLPSAPTNKIPTPPIMNQASRTPEAPPIASQQRDPSNAPAKKSPIILGDAPAA